MLIITLAVRRALSRRGIIAGITRRKFHSSIVARSSAMSDTMLTSPQAFVWEPQPAAWSLLLELTDNACQMNPQLALLRQQMLDQTGTRLVDWIDHIGASSSQVSDARLRDVGFGYSASDQAWHHPSGLFPRIVRPQELGFPREGLAIKVEDVDAFLAAHAWAGGSGVQGKPGADLRYAVVEGVGAPVLVVVERHGNSGWAARDPEATHHDAVQAAYRRFRSRPRPLTDAATGFAAVRAAFDQAAAVLGQAWACDVFFAEERRYWQSRNRAAQIQFARQNALGLGWANHDHHTYRSSREHFASLVGVLEHMGFECRERFYAGAQAGWGAQVLEHPVCPFVIFTDVDMSPEEVTGDFPHEGLAPRRQLGTVGLWCKLHGEAMLSAGLHHLECQFDFDAAREQLAREGIESMAPFTDFPFLRQAFTVGEQWPIERSHLAELVRDEWITAGQAEEFATEGARGSHLEVLERNDGYKGFNQTGISEIISRTDPRRRK
jgi:hypothetical protein